MAYIFKGKNWKTKYFWNDRFFISQHQRLAHLLMSQSIKVRDTLDGFETIKLLNVFILLRGDFSMASLHLLNATLQCKPLRRWPPTPAQFGSVSHTIGLRLTSLYLHR